MQKEAQTKCQCSCHDPKNLTSPLLCIMGGVCYKCSHESMQKPEKAVQKMALPGNGGIVLDCPDNNHLNHKDCPTKRQWGLEAARAANEAQARLMKAPMPPITTSHVDDCVCGKCKDDRYAAAGMECECCLNTAVDNVNRAATPVLLNRKDGNNGFNESEIRKEIDADENVVKMEDREEEHADWCSCIALGEGCNCNPEPVVVKMEQTKSEDVLIDYMKQKNWEYYWGAMFECGDYEKLLADIDALLLDQHRKSREVAIDECITRLRDELPNTPFVREQEVVYADIELLQLLKSKDHD